MREMWSQVLAVLVLLGLGYGLGSWRERRHIKALTLREQQFADMSVTSLKTVPHPESVGEALLVAGDAVIASDYFKSWAAKLRNIVGGEIRSFETLMSRARREATLRMLERAREAGATEVYNVRFETSNIRSAGRRGASASVEVFAFGTAVIRAPRQA
jgi:uncharacterized protein YbjQ (UPF0145 family)